MFAAATLVACIVGSQLFFRRLAQLRANTAPTVSAAHSAVSIIVPARNEAHNLPTLLASLHALALRPREILVVDDHSSDDTAEVAARYGARVITPEPVAEGYIGKTWACLSGAAVATGNYLLFTDADTWHAPDSLSRAAAALACEQVGLVSFVPTHRVVSWWERLQGIFQLLLLVATRAGAKRERGRAQTYANGQYLLFRRDVYERVGGHRLVSKRIAEDLGFARELSRAGHEVRVLFAPGALKARMYPEGFAAFFAGWRRNFREGMSSGGLRTVAEMIVIIAWLIGAPCCLAASALRADWSLAVWLAVYVGSCALVAREQRHYGPFGAKSALLYPLFVLVFVAVSAMSLIDALRGAPVQWRGRDIEVGR